MAEMVRMDFIKRNRALTLVLMQSGVLDLPPCGKREQ